jgi:hypothetical protein
MQVVPHRIGQQAPGFLSWMVPFDLPPHIIGSQYKRIRRPTTDLIADFHRTAYILRLSYFLHPSDIVNLNCKKQTFAAIIHPSL